MLNPINAYFLKQLLTEADKPAATENKSFDCTSVFLLVFNKNDSPFFLAILKADNPGYAWSNQVALPGGHVDESDLNSKEAAYRELEEEIGITRNHVEFIGSMGHFQTIQHKEIEVFLGVWDGQKSPINFDSREISKILEIPVDLLLKRHLKKNFQGRVPNIEELLYPFNDLVIWGVTARIYHYFFELLLTNESVFKQIQPDN